MKNLLQGFALILCLSFNILTFGQATPVKVIVDWDSNSYSNRVEIYDPANNLILSICDPDSCYQTSGGSNQFTAVYDLGCLNDASNYYIRVYNANNINWDNSEVIVRVNDNDELIDLGNDIESGGNGYQRFFNVSGGNATCVNLPDSDNDGLIDRIDLDDDNDGIRDTKEGLGINSFDCTIPSLDFVGGSYDAAASSGPDLEVGAVYRFPNALQGYDVLVEVLDTDGADLVSIDDDGTGIPQIQLLHFLE